MGNNKKYASGFWSALVRSAAENIVTGLAGAIAEFGCGEGLFLETLSINNPLSNIIGMDISYKSVQSANENLGNRFKNISVICGDALDTKIEAGSIDALFCVNTMLHFSDGQVEKLFFEAGRILKTSGSFIFDIRNLSNPLMLLQYRFRKYYDPANLKIVRAYDPDSIKALLDKYDFKIQDIRGIGVFSVLKLFIVRKK